MADAIAGAERAPCDIASLVLSLKCGGSDYTSGLAANPALGRVADLLVGLGGSAVLGEVAEIMGAETLLARVRRDLPSPLSSYGSSTASRQKRFALGLDIRGTQPSPCNIRVGLTTIEKSHSRRSQGG